MIVTDTSVLLALLDGSDDDHQRVVDWLLASDPDLVATPLVLAEVDHLVADRLGRSAASAWRAQIVAGGLAVRWWVGAELAAVQVAERYADLGVGLTDASLVALAEHLEVNEIATLDQRHFRAMTPLTAHPAFRLLPADA